MTRPVWTADELEEGIRKALQAKDVQAVYAMLLLLALKDPERADKMRRSLKSAVAVARSLREVPT